MKPPRPTLTVLLLSAIALQATPLRVEAAPGNAATAPASVGTLPSPASVKSVGNDPKDRHAIFSQDLNWNESVHNTSVDVPSPFDTAVNVLGVQGSGGVYITSIPATIPAKGTATVQYLLVSDPTGEASSDFIKVLTSGGIITVEIKHNRGVVAQFSATSLQWSVGGSPASKTVTLTMTPGTAVPIGVAALGAGNTATISEQGNGKYTITVTPESTAKQEVFPVVVTFHPRLPGVTGVIGCTVQ